MQSASPEILDRPLVAIAGATGFVGRALCDALGQDFRIRALTRRSTTADGKHVRWVRCDLFSVGDVKTALEGADVAIYLVHSMLPTARLTQASFDDLDLLLADNFARGAAAAGVGHILYVGGFAPRGKALSRHLRSRREVEEALRSRGADVTALRSGIIVGAGSSSLWILVNLVRRLPVMVLPRWTRSRTQPIALGDLVRAVRRVLDEPQAWKGSFDVGGPDVLTYREMMLETARIMGLRRSMITVGLLSPKLSRLWVTIFGSAPASLVKPLVESLRHDMVAEPNPLQDWLLPEAAPFAVALQRSLDEHARPAPPPSSIQLGTDERARLRAARTVRSVQRLPLPRGASAAWVAEEYQRLLPQLAGRWLQVEHAPDDTVRFRGKRSSRTLLELRYERARSAEDRAVFSVTGGSLARAGGGRGRLEFREIGGGQEVLAAVHDFEPALPWFIYNLTQARVHLWVMRRFARHLRADRRPA